MMLEGDANGLRRDRCIVLDRLAERVLHGVLTVAGRHLKDFQILPNGDLTAVLVAEPIVGHAKMAGRKQVLVIPVVLERTGLAYQRVDHMTVVDCMLAAARQAWHLFNDRSFVPDLDRIRVDHDVHLVADQSAVNRVRVAFDLNRAARANLDPA